MWRLEYQRRKENPVAPKAEWAYINFIQAYYNKIPDAPREEVIKAWESERERHKTIVRIIIEKNS